MIVIPSTIALYTALSLQNFSVVSTNQSKFTSLSFSSSFTTANIRRMSSSFRSRRESISISRDDLVGSALYFSTNFCISSNTIRSVRSAKYSPRIKGSTFLAYCSLPTSSDSVVRSIVCIRIHLYHTFVKEI